ncbi:secretory phospholipase A2 receptor-like [Siniperca chuatsi]|uniref:secretory phospholipase A2 receptor-like n=1 Tax=Siniperca chuatsi TaxID=119488 RepID=UPI001CE109AC|nr:secretory phospholipase A2 receptor-like [Siniperca chuatsi]
MKSESNNLQKCTLSLVTKHLCIRKNMLHLVILLLASGCVTLCSHSLRDYYLIKEAKIWDEAQSNCRKNYTDLATIGSHDDMKRLVNMTAASGVTTEIWIGLKETGVASWLWSVGETQTSHGLAEYTNWAIFPNSSHYCGGMRGDGKWLSALCETTLPFVCQEYKGSSGVYVVLQEQSWRQAQEYCRLKNSDLASVRSQTENQALQQTVNENGTSLSLVWIGLFRDEWKWSDKSDSSFRYWDSSQPNNDGVCSLYNPSSKNWYDRGCTNSYFFFCYNEKKVMRQIVRVEMKSDPFFNFSVSAVSKAILNQIQKKYEGVKLQWSVQPDGNIFHKKERN